MCQHHDGCSAKPLRQRQTYFSCFSTCPLRTVYRNRTMNLEHISQGPQELATVLASKDPILLENYMDSIAYLYDYLLQLSRDGFYLENRNVFQRMTDFLGHVHTYLSNPEGLQYITLSASFIHYTISLIVETTHIIVCLKISETALNSGTVSVSYRTHNRMKNLLSLAKHLEERVFELQEFVDKVCCKMNRSPNLQSIGNIMEQIKNIKSILSYLSESSVHLSDFLTKEVDSKLQYFDWMSLSVAVLCFSQIIHSLMSGKGNKDLSQMCVWFTCVGSSAVVLQLPRTKFGIIRSILLHHNSEYSKLSQLFQLEVNKEL